MKPGHLDPERLAQLTVRMQFATDDPRLSPERRLRAERHARNLLRLQRTLLRPGAVPSPFGDRDLRFRKLGLPRRDGFHRLFRVDPKTAEVLVELFTHAEKLTALPASLRRRILSRMCIGLLIQMRRDAGG